MRDAVATMGGILPDDVDGRDAVHVAVLAVKAIGDLVPGQDVGVTRTSIEWFADPMSDAMIGIVDPFIKGLVKKGERFWLYLYPRSITGLNHHWTHPAFDGDGTFAANKAKSEEWIKNFAKRSDVPSYHALMEAAQNSRYDGESLTIYGSDASGNIPPEFWDHAENVLGEKIPQGERAKYFSCSC